MAARYLEEEIILEESEKKVLRKLGEEIAQISSLPVHKEKAELWKNLNDLNSKRPMVWMTQVPWHEMNVNNELTLLCRNEWAKELEDKLRKIIYQWKHMPGDMIVNDYIECPLVINSTKFGISEDVDISRTDETSDVYSRHFKIQISEPEDIYKIKMPVVTHDEKATKRNYDAMCQIFDGIIPVKKTGQGSFWYAPWDFLVRIWGVQEAMMDLALRPEMVHDAYERMVTAWMTDLDQREAQNLLSANSRNMSVGSGGYGYVSGLPWESTDTENIGPKNLWGCSSAQIFATVSPQMHWEFAIEHDMKWLERWGLTYYGCCEPLHGKIHLLRKIRNLRKISVSPWCKLEKIVDEIGTDYVMSRKPSPSIFAGHGWSPEQAEKELRDFMEITEGKCHVELIMKDISTVGYEPQNLWEWERIAMKVAEEYAR